MSGEDKQVDNLANLLDDTLGDFEKRRVTDDDLDEIMAEYDKQAIQKSTAEFDEIMHKLTEQTTSDITDQAIPGEDDPEMNEVIDFMKKCIFQSEISKMIDATIVKYDDILGDADATFSTEQRENYEKQKTILKELSETYVSLASATPEAEQGITEKIVELWQQIHELGNPPEHLIEMQANLAPSGDAAPECSIM
uniref:Peroxin-19 n=1 Tax=Panagrellus redivivus TaxID=6233 RepID=A0A7E4W0J8_PANRE